MQKQSPGRSGFSRSRGATLLAVLLQGLAFAGVAEAATLSVEATKGPMVVIVDGGQQRDAPATLDDIEPGKHTLAFKATAFGPVLFMEEIVLETDSATQVVVDLSARKVRLEHQQTEVEEISTEAPAAPAVSPDASVEGGNDANVPVAAVPEEPPPPSGDLYIEADVEGASIIIDGQDSGQHAPVMISGLPLGKHEVTLTTECARARGEVEIRDGLIQRLELTMRTGTGSLSISTVPDGATVFLDGEDIGPSPQVVKDISCGAHELVFRAPGYLEATHPLRTPAFVVTSAIGRLTKETYGTLVIAPTPLNATVVLDGVSAGHGPMTVEGVGSGLHELELAAEGYDPWKQQVDILADQITRLDVALTPHTFAKQATLPWGRLGLDAGVTAGGLGLGIASLATYLRARDKFPIYLEITSDDEAVAYYNESILPLKRTALAEGIAGGALLVAGGVLFVTTDWSVSATNEGVAINGRW